MLEKIRKIGKKKILAGSAGILLLIPLTGYVLEFLIRKWESAGNGAEVSFWDPGIFFRPSTFLTGLLVFLLLGLLYAATHMEQLGLDRSPFGKPGTGTVESVLENSRFMTDRERDENFLSCTYDNICDIPKDGIPVRALLDRKGVLHCSFLSGAHALVIGATGSGKTTSFINPMIQLLAASQKGSSMIMTDPKGELLELHSAFLEKQGYTVRVLDLRDTWTSHRWNPLGSIWDSYQEYLQAGRGIRAHTDGLKAYPDLIRADEGEVPEGAPWFEYAGRAYTDAEHCMDDVSVRRQRIYDGMYEDLNDLISVLCPVTNEKDPLWEKGARSIIMAACLAMLEDSGDPRLSMTREKFTFFNVNRLLSQSENDYEAVKDYFRGRSPLSPAVTLSRQVLSAPPETMGSYLSITYDKLNMFNDQGICGLTGATDIEPERFAEEPTALFIKIPDEKDTRHGLAAVFILCIYKALIKKASESRELTLPRNVYFLLDEFGNIPRIEKFEHMITVGRSRKIWFNMVIQSYAQLNAVYGERVADIIKSNCAMKMFIGSNDIGTCKEFSELCGNMTVKTTGASASSSAKDGEKSISTQLQVRPLIYPSELQKLNNRQSTGNAIVVTFGNYPLRTRFTPSYLCSRYQTGMMDMGSLRNHMFRPEAVYYDVEKRNRIILSE